MSRSLHVTLTPYPRGGCACCASSQRLPGRGDSSDRGRLVVAAVTSPQPPGVQTGEALAGPRCPGAETPTDKPPPPPPPLRTAFPTNNRQPNKDPAPPPLTPRHA